MPCLAYDQGMRVDVPAVPSITLTTCPNKYPLVMTDARHPVCKSQGMERQQVVVDASQLPEPVVTRLSKRKAEVTLVEVDDASPILVAKKARHAELTMMVAPRKLRPRRKM